MPYCGKYGAQMDDSAKFCPACGAPGETPKGNEAQQQNDYGEKLQNFNNTNETTAEFDPQDIQNNKVMAILAYLGILVLIPLFAAKESKFARYHTNQGLVLCIAEIAYGITYGVLSSIILAISWRLYFITSIIGLVSLVFLVILVIGIMNAANGRAKELPIIGKFKMLK